ncbi:MAG: Murein tetrapeptide carboxypeptidase [Paracidovorax wautersii]|uniref:Murein tetrapeptide carboxypeptidase n=1 Tax=Paracidovorax wautersii TaxID=1177982 RepID=A0A7V8FKG8_9BURK|nr:MAG: Murein tetrapeptide carboxypeptidase [Paracidovorax wautersii]
MTSAPRYHCIHCAQLAGVERGPARIYVYSPSGAMRDKAAFKRGRQHLKAMGFEVDVDANALRSTQRFAGDDAARVDAIHRAAASGANAALISRGGYGLTRILPLLDYDRLDEAVRLGTQFIGHSDFTALQLAMLAQRGTLSWAGPALGADFGAEEGADDIMQACFEDVLAQQSEGTGWRLPAADLKYLDQLAPHVAEKPVQNATLWGGNLAVVCALAGTPYFPAIEGGVLFLEDVGEHPYKIERMFTQLLLSGILQKQSAILLGAFTDYKITPHDRGYKLQTVIDWLRQQLPGTPVLTGLPFGHVRTKVMLPVGAPVTLEVAGRDAMLFWGHLGHTH